jgi:hypothetical protein
MIVHLDNALTGLTISDFYDPAYTPKGEAVDIYPRKMNSSPFNLHTHGMHISPRGNADNVMLHIPGGMSNTYTFDLPKDLPHGAYWYHSHLHLLTTSHVYYGLAGQLAIGRIDGNLPIVTENKIPIRNMLLQYNYVFDRAGGLAQLNNPNWAQYVSTLKAPEKDALKNGTYRPLLVPTNFFESKKGTRYAPSGTRDPPTGIMGRARFPNRADSSISSRPICSASPPCPAGRSATFPPTPRFRTICATSSSP